MTLRKQEWRSLADAGRLYETMASFEFLQKCAKALKINEKTAATLSEALQQRTYRPLGGNEVDTLLLKCVLDALSALIKEDSGLDLYRTLRTLDLATVQIQVEKLDFACLKKELFKLLKEAVPDEEFVDLVWKGAKIAEEDVLEKLAPLLKQKHNGVLIRGCEMLSISGETAPGNGRDFEFGGYAVKLEPDLKILPAKSSIEAFKRDIKNLTTRSRVGYSVRFSAVEITRRIRQWHESFGFCTDRKLGRYLDSYVRERVYLLLLKKFDKAGKKEVYQRFMLGYPTLEGITIPSTRPVGEPYAGKPARTVRGAGG